MTQFSRREFLEQSFFASAALSLVGSRTSLAAENQAASSSDKFRVAVVGVKGRGSSHIAGFLDQPDCEITALVDVDEVFLNMRAAEIEAKTGKKPVTYSDMRKCFEDKSIDIVSIATPNHWHSLAAIWAIQAGKDVYVEKPVSHNVSEGRRVVEAARKYNRIVQTGTQSRSNPGMRAAIEHIHKGGIGNVSLAHGLCYKRRPPIKPKGNYDIPASVDYELWSGPAPKQVPLTRENLHYDWHWIWDFGNGDLGNQGIHQMDLARWGLNEMNLGVSVSSYGGRFGPPDAGETANTQVCTHDFADGKRLVFEVRGMETQKYMGAGVGVIFKGTDGYLVLTSYNGGVVLDKDGKETGVKFDGGGDKNHYSNFIKAVRSRKHTDLNADILDGHLSSALCHLGNVSYRLGNQQKVGDMIKNFAGDVDALDTLDRFQQHLRENMIDPEATPVTVGPTLTIKDEVFVGDRAAEANKMLTREYRAPFIVPKTEDL